MSVYIPAELRRQVREQFANCCAYCHTAEELTVAVFEIDHILPIAALNMNRAQLTRLRRIWVKLSEHPPAIE
jgi:hypothetical protein